MNAAQRPDTSASYPVSQPFSQSTQPTESTESRRTYSPKRTPYKAARQAIAFESSVKLTVNLLLAIVATTTIAKLVPYYQSQQQRLSTLQTSVATAERKNAELREQFNHNFDPAQASRIMQEQSGMGYPNQKQVIWTAPRKAQ
ncbi:MAG: hypothetical protein AAFY72_03110 [Cyanobacteria bacterium J06649_4]